MFHERMSFNSPLVTLPEGSLRRTGRGTAVQDYARAAGRLDDPRGRELVGESHVLGLVGDALQRRIARGIATGTISDQGSAIGRLYAGKAAVRRNSIAFELAGSAGAAWADDDGAHAGLGTGFLMRQTSCIAGGTTEMAAKVVSERVLGMPREQTLDRDVPFRDVPRSAPSP